MNFTADQNLFRREPIGLQNGIPVFSHIDSYVANYQRIAHDHIAAIKPGASNPFIAEQLWKQLEVSTRDLVLKYCQPKARVLDVGVGLGRILAPLENLDRYGIDISIDYLERARSEGIKVAFSRIEDMPFVDQCFDMVLVTDVLEHVFDLNHCTQEILRVLKPGGVLIVRVPYKEDLAPYLSKDLPYKFVHMRNFDEYSLRLHFCKVFDMLFLEAESVAPYLQGAARLRLQLLSAHDCELLQESLVSPDPSFDLLRDSNRVNSEKFVTWIYELRDKHPDKYRAVERQLVMGIEINAVFRKCSVEVRRANSAATVFPRDSVSSDNASFWDELCGSQAAQTLDIKDSSPQSLKRFDDWYFAFYPYLPQHIPFDELDGRDVLEIGLGYGTVSQRLAESGAQYKGLDIAKAPVNMVNQRLLQSNLSGEALQGSILSPPFEPESFDVIVAIGCLHHTGNLKAAIAQCHRLLRPGGKLIFMVYYAYSYRRWFKTRQLTAKYLLSEIRGYRGVVGHGNSTQRAAYDTGSSGQAAPHTDWISKKSLKQLCRNFTTVTCSLENIEQEPPFSKTPRKELLGTPWPKWCGLDVYCHAVK